MYRSHLRKLFTNQEIEDAIGKADSNLTIAAQSLTLLGRGGVKSANLSYWWKQLLLTKKNGEPYIGTTVLDRKIRENMTLRKRTPEDDHAITIQEITRHARILIFTDPHAPYHHPDYIAFLESLNLHYNFDTVLCGGDEVDGHALSFHDSDPDLDSAGPELAKARKFLSKLAKLFPTMKLVHSNHGSLAYRRAKKAGIPAEMIKSYRDILFPDGGGEGWSWHEEVRLTLPNGEEIQLEHTRTGDVLANAAHERCNFIKGHQHSMSEITYSSSKAALYWGAVIGCGLDKSSAAFDYGKLMAKRPILAVLIIINSLPVLVPMKLNKEGRWTGEVPRL